MLRLDRTGYNAKALTNKGNCLLVKGDLETAKQFYLEAIGVEADCVEAIYNLGLVNWKQRNYDEANTAFAVGGRVSRRRPPCPMMGRIGSRFR